jgi:hypothetical protein
MSHTHTHTHEDNIIKPTKYYLKRGEREIRNIIEGVNLFKAYWMHPWM